MHGKIAKGKVIHKEGKYHLETEGKVKELSFVHAPAAQLKELVGQEVEVIISTQKDSILGIYKGRWCFILCYIPVDIKQIIIQEEVAQKLLLNFAKAGLVPQEIVTKIGQQH